METQLMQENAQLKEIIRTNDRRIHYLESKIKNIVNNEDINTCFLCGNVCDYDEEKCHCNMFCTNYVCRVCINKKSQELLQCEYSKCKKWYCELIGKHPPAIACIDCNIVYCKEHFRLLSSHTLDSMNTQRCVACNTKKEYDYCEE